MTGAERIGADVIALYDIVVVGGVEADAMLGISGNHIAIAAAVANRGRTGSTLHANPVKAIGQLAIGVGIDANDIAIDVRTGGTGVFQVDAVDTVAGNEIACACGQTANDGVGAIVDPDAYKVIARHCAGHIRPQIIPNNAVAVAVVDLNAIAVELVDHQPTDRTPAAAGRKEQPLSPGPGITAV